MSGSPEPLGDARDLLQIPFVFSQVELVSLENFRKAAGDWDLSVTASELRSLRADGLLVPLFADVNVQDAMQRIDVIESDRSPIARYARDGLLREPGDPAVDDPDAELYYSRWQLLGLRDALREAENRRVLEGRGYEPPSLDFVRRLRAEHIALAALSTRYFPQIVGQLSLPLGSDHEELQRSRRDIGAADRLAAAHLGPDRLRAAAEFLLLRAHSHDPMAKWWDLLRYSDHRGWFQLKGRALESIWQRIAAEVLLRAHEELAKDGVVSPLPEPSANPSSYSPLMDRVGPQVGTDSLPVALTRFGLSPQPRVVLVLEGDVEMFQVDALMDDVDLDRSRVRLVRQGTSSDHPVELARFVAPRLGRRRLGRVMMEGPPTALVVAMDNEGDFLESNGALRRTTANLREHVRDSVTAQGGALTDEEVDTLVDVRTWGPQKYELANFSDAQLAAAMARVAIAAGDSDEDASVLEASLLRHLQYARSRQLDVKVVYNRMQWDIRKMDLARELLPCLVVAFNEATEYDDLPPVLKLLEDVRKLVQRLSAGAFSLELSTDESA